MTHCQISSLASSSSVAGADFLAGVVAAALNGETLSHVDCLRILQDRELPLLPLLQAAFQIREKFFGRNVRVHILNNLQNGLCSEDCNYCAQARSSTAAIQTYPIKSDDEILDGARRAAESGSFRYCMALSGKGPKRERVEHLAGLVRRIKQQYKIEVCLSAGFLDPEMAALLKEAGLDRYNHNVNTSASHYGRICTSHEYQDRIATLESARSVGLEVCSGLIIGMGESADDIIEVAHTLRRIGAKSIPVNFYMHIPGSRLGEVGQLTPEYCLRVLCLFRFLHPTTEIRAAGGREINLRSLESLCLYPANSLFSEGYLNSTGHSVDKTVQMITDAGFVVERIEE